MKWALWSAIWLQLVACGDSNHEPDEPGGPPTHSDAQACFADLTMPASGWVEIQRFHTAEHGIKLWRARQTTDGPTVGETTAYELVRFWVESADEPGTCVTAPEALTYSYQHHNWDETWQANTLEFRYLGHEPFNLGGEPPWLDTLTVKDATGATLVSDVPLIEDGCNTLPYDLNACVLRTRSDAPPPGWGEE